MACLTAHRYHQHHRHRHHNHHHRHRHRHHHHHHHLEHSFRGCLSQYWDIDSDSHGSWSAPFALLQQAILCYNGPWGTFPGLHTTRIRVSVSAPTLNLLRRLGRGDPHTSLQITSGVGQMPGSLGIPRAHTKAPFLNGRSRCVLNQ